MHGPAKVSPQGAATYRVRHDTEYCYGAPVLLSHQLLRLTPRSCPWQHCDAHRIEVTPVPAEREERDDYFGNREVLLALDTPHTELRVAADSIVTVLPRTPHPQRTPGPAWEAVRAMLHVPQDAASLDACQYLYESPHVPAAPQIVRFAAPLFPAGAPVLEAAAALMAHIHREFEFDPEATTVATPLAEVLENRRGVCQDFAHLMLACLRAQGLAARYVSGYLLTTPPPGKPRLTGADASHAWVSLYVPDTGWVDLDPTNDLLPDTQHITLAWGRDFSDVSPLRGVILGGGEHEVEVRVTVEPETVASEAPRPDGRVRSPP